MLDKFQNIFRIPELRSRILFTLGILAICRLGTHVPMPGVSASAIANAADMGGFFAFWDLFAGGAIQRASVFALGIMPHITASIIFSLLVTVIPALERLQKEGDTGRQKITRYTRYLTVALCIVQSIPISKTIINSGLVLGEPGPGFTLTCMVSLTAGGILLMWLGEQISERGIGNGISLLIFVNIISRMPAVFYQVWTNVRIGDMSVLTVIILLMLLFVVVGAVVVLTQAQRRIPIQYPRQVRGRRSYGGARSYLPLRVLHAGVIPIIFASSMLMLPKMLVGLISSDTVAMLADSVLNPMGIVYNLMYTVLIVFFAYFYTAIVFNPIQIADDLKKYGGFIPGIRPGRPTAQYLDFVMTRITLAGSLALAMVAMMPLGISKVLEVDYGIASFFGGTSLLIIVGVALDTVRQIETHLLMRQYDGFMSSGRIRGRR